MQGEGWSLSIHAASPIPRCPLETGGSPVSGANGEGGVPKDEPPSGASRHLPPNAGGRMEIQLRTNPLPALRATFPLNAGGRTGSLFFDDVFLRGTHNREQLFLLALGNVELVQHVRKD